jgi:hypothetical protein
MLSERMQRLLFGSLAAIHLGLGVWMVASPRSFFDTVGAFGEYNPHYVRDTATFYLAFALGAAIAFARPGWRIPVLAVTAVQYVIHTVNHVFDADEANNSWAGPVDAISLGLAAVQFVGALVLLLNLRRGVRSAPGRPT